MNASLLATLGALSLVALKLALIPCVVWLTKHATDFLATHTAKAQAEHKAVKVAQAEESLGRFTLLGLNSIASTVKADLDAGKTLSSIGLDAAKAAKSFASENGLAEVQELLGITTAGLEVKLNALATSKLVAATASVGSPPTSPSVPAAK